MEIKQVVYFAISIQILCIVYIFFKSKSTEFFISNLKTLNTFIIAIGVFLTFLIFQKNYEKNVIDTGVNIIEKSQKNVLKEIIANCDKCPDFCTTLLNTKETLPYKTYTYQQDDKNTIIYLTYLILQSVEDYILSSTLTNYSDVEWASFYIYLFSGSELLQTNYNFYKFLVGNPSKNYIENIIKIANETSINNATDIEKAARKFVNSKNFKKIMNSIYDDPDVVSLN